MVNHPCRSPCSTMGLLSKLFQKPSPLVEVQAPFIGLYPDSKIRDQRVTCIPLVLFPCFCRYYLQENHRGKLQTFIFSQFLWHHLSYLKSGKHTPKICTPVCFEKEKPHTLVNSHSSFLFTLSYISKHITQILPHLRHVKSDCAERFSRDGQQGKCSVAALKSWRGRGSHTILGGLLTPC